MQERPDPIHTVRHSYLEAAQYNHSLTLLPLSSSTGVVEVKGLAQGHFSDGNEGGTSTDLSLSPPRFYPVGLGIEPTTSRSPLTSRPPLPCISGTRMHTKRNK